MKYIFFSPYQGHWIHLSLQHHMLPVMWQILHGKHHCWYFCRCKNNNNKKVSLTILLLLTTIGLTTTKPGFFNKILQEISVNILSWLSWQARGGGEVIWGFQNFVLHTWRGNPFFFHFGNILFSTMTEHVFFLLGKCPDKFCPTPPTQPPSLV